MFSKKIIYDYVMGNDLDNYDIDELENNSIFMKQVIDYTNDKNMYNLCGKKLKNDYDFIKYIIEKLSDNLEFIRMVADEYIKNNQKEDFEPNCVELKIIMSNIVKNKDNEEFFKYKLSTIAFQEYVLTQIALIKEKLNKEDLGMGFYIIQSIYPNNPKIVEHFAKKFIKEIFYENEKYTFEELIHKNSRNYQQIKGLGIINYLIKYVSNYDCELSSYLCAHVNLLSKPAHSLECVKDNWNNFINAQSMIKFELFENAMYAEYSKYPIPPTYSISQLVEFVIKKLNIDKRYKIIGEYLKKIEERDLTKLDLSVFENPEMSFIDYKFLKFAINKARQIFYKDVIGVYEDVNENLDEKEFQGQVKIINLKTKK